MSFVFNILVVLHFLGLASLIGGFLAVKLLFLLVIIGLILANRKKPSITNGVWGAIGGLAILNVIIAVFWS